MSLAQSSLYLWNEVSPWQYTLLTFLLTEFSVLFFKQHLPVFNGDGASVWAGTTYLFGQVPVLFGQLPVTCLGSYQLLYRSGCPHCLHLMTAHLVYWRCLMPSICCSSAFFLWYQAGFLGCGSPPGPKGSANRRLVSAIPEVSGGKMKTNGGATTSGTACGGANGREGRGG